MSNDIQRSLRAFDAHVVFIANEWSGLVASRARRQAHEKGMGFIQRCSFVRGQIRKSIPLREEFLEQCNRALAVYRSGAIPNASSKQMFYMLFEENNL